MTEQTRTWRIGELAEQAGITVRTLHHYDQLGLLSPSSRTSGGHRCYTNADVVHLHRIIALRSCGLSLEEVGAVLAAHAEADLVDLLHHQLDVVDERVRQAVALRARLVGVLDALGRTAKPSATEILRLIEETITMNQPLTREQFTRLTEERARQLRVMSSDGLEALKKKMENIWTALSPEERARLVEQRRRMLPAAG